MFYSVQYGIGITIMSSIKWDIEKRCNLNCKHCIVNNIEYKENLTLSMKMSVVDKLKNIGFRHIVFTSKEPLIDSNFLDLVEYCSFNNIYSSIITNGTLVNEKCISRLKKLKIKDFAISLEGWENDDNDFIRGKGVFTKITKLLNSLESCKSFTTVIQLNLTKMNFNKTKSFLDYFSRFENLVIMVGNLMPLGNCKKNSYLCCDLDQYFGFVLNVASQSNNNTIIFESLDFHSVLLLNSLNILNQKPNIPFCSLQNGGYSIGTDGTIYRCFLLENKECKLHFKNKLGNIMEYSFEKNIPLIDIQNFYKNNVNCSKCIIKNSCNLCYLYTSTGHYLEYLRRCHLSQSFCDGILELIFRNIAKFSLNKNVIIHETSQDSKHVYRKYNTQMEEVIKEELISNIYKLSKYKDYIFLNESNLSEDEIRLLFYNDLISVEGVDVYELLSNNK